MLLYTHVVTALKVKSLLSLDINDPGAYLLGSILPDVRYLAGIPREQTHLDMNTFFHIIRENNICDRDIITGYLVHLAADNLNELYLRDLLFPNIPRISKKTILTGLFSIILEIYYQTQPIDVPPVSDNAGKLGRILNIPPEYISELTARADRYLRDPCLDQAVKSIAGSTVESNKNVNFYINIGKFIHDTASIRNYIINKVSNVNEKLENVLADRCVKHIEMLRYLDI